ncbi:DUF4349 domain-containing protein [Cellulomonas sp. PhB150]|uniref:DUF4349 domain-containing protein n=1 Tax=Cellulomonas sp. PhB150 TaxID=2485188 RepID=UPI000F47CE1C|nr:DUF4349 domain-containing protein [Cellulomonas sp. PhB150]ROS31299.1 uncharacterized protein DUF4349 [Cellulomonas sp. PhB150]
MTTSTARPTHRTGAVLAGAALLVALLAGCSASDDAGSASEPASVAGGADSAADGVAASTEEGGDQASTLPASGEERQVVQTGDLDLRVKDARTATDAVVTRVEAAGGRVDDRSEQATTEDSAGSATLVVRIPADQVTPVIDGLDAIGTVDRIDLKSTDVTGAAQDLDARIHALEVSVDRMDALLAKATTSKDIIDAESALTERQSNLEQLQAERNRLADQVSLSTLTVNVYGPDVAPPVETEGPTSFLDGIGVGWDAFLSSAKAVLVVAGVLLPWLAFGGAIAAGIVALVRWNRRRRPAGPVAQPAPMRAYVAPAEQDGPPRADG